PVLLQPVDTAAVSAALDGETFIGNTPNFLDRGTLAAAAPLDVADLGWVVVTEQQTSETRDELEQFVLAILLLLAILLSALAIVGLFLARVLARPVRPLVAAAGRIADGDYHTGVPDLGRNELGDVGAQLEAVAARLREQETSIEAEEERINEMLATVLPPALVDRVRSGERELAEVVDTATVISVSVTGIPAPSGAEQDAVVELTTRLADEAARIALAHGVERAQAALEHQVYVTGRGGTSVDADAAIAFARDVVAELPRVGAEFGVVVTARAGLSAGLVATGVLGSRQVSFGVWGTPVTDAATLDDHAAPGEIRLDASVVDELDQHQVLPVEGSDGEWLLQTDDEPATT
ncbi:MAG: HAMP domain-containing protein, partial [Ilumatobacter sp.]|nr:HAMP domain-containing protein [Ilumatobacter sp.]